MAIGGDFTFNPFMGISGSKSKSEAKMLSPNLGDAAKGFQTLQPKLMSNVLQESAISEQQGLRGRLSNLLDNATGGLASRGFAGSSLNIPAQLGVERERNMAHMQLQDQLLGRRMGMESDVSKNISDLLFGSSEQATNLQAALLGAQGIGNFAESSTGKAPTGGGASGGGAGPGEVGAEAYQRFQDWAGQFQQPGFRDAQGSPGGGASGGGGGGGSPQAYANPFAAQSNAPQSWQTAFPDGSDPLNPDDDGTGPIVITQDKGPEQDPEEFAKNAARLDKAQAEGRPISYGDYQASPMGPLAQSAAGTSGMISSGGMMA
jgi:hypothetical protein